LVSLASAGPLQDDLDDKVMLIWDGLPVAPKPPHAGLHPLPARWLVVERLPGCAPDLNRQTKLVFVVERFQNRA
jgi:hypothetical protein